MLFLLDLLDELIVFYVISEEDFVVLLDSLLFIVEFDFYGIMDVVMLWMEGNWLFVK